MFSEEFWSNSEAQENHGKMLIFRKFILYEAINRFGVYY